VKILDVLHLKIEKREEVGLVWRILSIVIALAAAFLISAFVIEAAGANYREAFISLFIGAFGSWNAFTETLVKSIPLLFTGLATAIAFKGKIWTIGQEGPGILKARFDVDEVISTVMGNYIITYLLSLLLSGIGPWREPNSFYQQTPTVEKIAQYPILVPNTRLHVGFALAIILAIIVYVIMERTPLGYEIRAFGSNPNAVRFKGVNISRLYIVVMIISGGLCGLAGVNELFGVQYRLKLNLSPGYGYTGIIVAMLAELHPLVIIPVSILFGGLLHGSLRMQVITGVPTASINAIQAIILLFFLTSQVLTKYRIRRVSDGS
jgi:ABC-type uncharacterized transport system permease subunit